MEIYVIRHGLSEANLKGVIQGHADSSLSETGRQQANLLGQYLARENVQPVRIFASPLRRARETASIIASNLSGSTEVEPVEGLKEIDVGTLSGLSLEESLKQYPNGWSGDVNKWLDFSIAGGEKFEEFFERVSGAVSEIMAGWNDLPADETYFFVTHAGSMRPILKTLLATESDMMFFSFGNCCHAKVTFREFADSIRRVMSELVTIEKVAGLMQCEPPVVDFEDSVGKKIG